jgi:hypothetical protein
MMNLFGPLRRVDFWSGVAFNTDGDGSGGSKSPSSSSRPKARPSNLNTSRERTSFSRINTDSDDNATRLAAANAADVAEDVRVQRIQNTARESGALNSAYENTMNRITPNDGKEYIGGQLVESVGASRDSLQGRGMNNAPGMLGQGQTAFNYLSGAGADDLAVGFVDGQRIYQRDNGTTYTVNGMGLASSTAGPDTLDPIQDNSGMMYQMGSDNSDNSAPAAPVSESIGGGSMSPAADPCPEGYMLDPLTDTCIIDQFQTPFAEAPATGAAPMPQQQLSPYTAANPSGGIPTLTPGQPSNFAVPTPTMQPITMGQQGLASLPPRMG